MLLVFCIGKAGLSLGVVVADQWRQDGELYKHGNIDNSCCNVHTILESKLWKSTSDLCVTSANHSDECLRCAGEHGRILGAMADG